MAYSLKEDEFVVIRHRRTGRYWYEVTWHYAPLFKRPVGMTVLPCGRAESYVRVELGLDLEEVELIRLDEIRNLKY